MPLLAAFLMNLGAISSNKDKSPKRSKFFGLDLKKKKKRVMEERKSSVSDVGAWGMNIISSVGIIMVNKQLMSQTGFAFSFATTLTGFHFSVTALVGWISNASGYSESKSVPFWELLWFSIIANTSITAMNFSLMLNSVGFYQISKLSMIPVVCVMEWILHGKQYSREVKMAVVVVVVGVGVCTVTDVKVNAKGFLCALVAILCTSLQQISIGSLQKKYSIGSFELLSKTAPIQALSLLTVGPFIDYCLTSKSLLKYNYAFSAFCFILLSCSLAVFCNISQYLCIGRFSAVSFQVLGHMKTVCVLMLGWLLFDSEMTLKNISGMVLAIIGMVVYSWAVEIEKQANAMSIPQPKSQLSDEELMLLKEGMDDSSLRDEELGQLPK
ncbi:UDP-rhamnose/UDP-galactose transporter 3-like isoform X1 [Cucurbita maxima]|uniref:UDP-rhamnose/UDP-galactose transporter 3-like isoform X1 n=2 Tax=Cucurbita maxima TaxID=3661 RepID=A0A6J1JC82_CUCMA|nr:UDP-rhamnose/UDP-galactose transporter 3-like isoform X1 [Cucurbita maxima]